MSSTGVKFRELDLSAASETGFVYKSWLGSYKNHADVIPYSMYRKLYQALLDRVIRRPGAVVVLAVHPEHNDQIFGFACIERDSATLHYIYVKENFRRSGIGADILEFINQGNESGEFAFTFSTSLGRKYLRPRGGKYKPRLVRNEL